MDMIREMKTNVTPGGEGGVTPGNSEETEESKNITDQIKNVIIEKDALIEEL